MPSQRLRILKTGVGPTHIRVGDTLQQMDVFFVRKNSDLLKETGFTRGAV